MSVNDSMSDVATVLDISATSPTFGAPFGHGAVMNAALPFGDECDRDRD
jgi:hypothetical protein